MNESDSQAVNYSSTPKTVSNQLSLLVSHSFRYSLIQAIFKSFIHLVNVSASLLTSQLFHQLII